MANKKLDQIIVIDVEATCWDGEPPEGQESEIIEIGICPLEVITGNRLEKRSIIVRPERSTVSSFCTRLTTLTQVAVDNGISFEEACALLKREYRTKHRVWASYGDYDRHQFELQCRTLDIPYPFGLTHINVKNLFAIFRKLSHEVGMTQALKFLDLPLEGVHHRGDDDAWNIAAILSELLL
jgi:inhibitor of KinA sporulation pathway (predicted exonuclease)